jgi:ABC-2 type transport system ATP-binding protein
MFSGGCRTPDRQHPFQRLQAAGLFRPEHPSRPYLLLDEPTDGLDPNQKHEIRTMIRAMSDRKTIFLSTHILDEMDALCTRAIIIARGKVLVDETPDQLKKRSALRGAIRLTVKATESQPVMDCIAGVEGVESTKTMESDPGLVVVQVLPRNPEMPPVDGLLAAIQSGGLTMESIAVEEGRLDDVFRAITDSDTSTAT